MHAFFLIIVAYNATAMSNKSFFITFNYLKYYNWNFSNYVDPFSFNLQLITSNKLYRYYFYAFYTYYFYICFYKNIDIYAYMYKNYISIFKNCQYIFNTKY